MATAAILSLEACRDPRRRGERRQRLHDRFDPWLDGLEDHVKTSQPPLAELTQAVFALQQELTQAVTEGLVEQAHRALVEQRTATCPQGGQTLSARGPQERTVETLVGAIRLRRPYVYGERCQLSTTPLDEALRLTERRQPPDVQQAAVQLTTEVPYETACDRTAPEGPYGPRGDASRRRGVDGLGGRPQSGGDRRDDRRRGSWAAVATPPGPGHGWRRDPYPPGDGERPAARAPAGPGPARPVDRGVAGSERLPVLPARRRRDRPGPELAPSPHGRRGGGSAPARQGRWADPRGGSALVCEGRGGPLALAAGAGPVPVGGGDRGRLSLSRA